MFIMMQSKPLATSKNGTNSNMPQVLKHSFFQAQIRKRISKEQQQQQQKKTAFKPSHKKCFQSLLGINNTFALEKH